MKTHTKRALSLLLMLAMTISLFAGLSMTASAGSVAAVDPTGYKKAEDVKYVKVGNYVCNWGARGEDCTFLSTYAQNYYTGNYAYSVMSKLSGGTTQSNASSSALYSALKNMMVSKKTSETSYNGTRELYKYTDCLKSDYKHISSFYSGKQLNGEWDGGSTWNREHTWPNSKITGNGENDISMLRPTWVKENSDRGNKAYGESSSAYYNPNSESGGKYDLRGDCARIVLFVYTRWGVTDKMWGSSGVMENMDILLKWMTEDPVDTWEMGRNDACQSIVGCRNAFIDFPEYAFLLFGKSIPANYVSPSSGAAPVPGTYTVSAVSNNNAWGTVSVKDYTVTCTPASGYYLADAKITSGDGSLSISGNTITVSPKSNCTVSVTFAKIQTVTVSFVLPDGVTKAAISGTSGSKAVLSAPTGTPTDTAHSYAFAGWLDRELADTTVAPSDLILPGTNYTLSKDITLYAVYSYPEDTQEQGNGDYVKVTTAPADWSGEYVIVYETENYLFNSSLETLDASSNYYQVYAISNQTVTAEDGDPYKITVEKVNGGYAILCANGQYMGMTSSDNKILQSDAEKYVNTISLNENGGADIVSANCYLRYNQQNGQTRFRYYKASSYANQQQVHLYRKDSSTTVIHYLTLAKAGPQPCVHTYTNTVTSPTCTTGGYTTHTCSKCGDSYVDSATSALGHNYSTTITAPTCTAQGYTTHTCSRCTDSYKDTYTNALGHSWDAGVVTKPATATETGIKTYTCTRCSATKTETIPATGEETCKHQNVRSEHKDATCTESGYDRTVCKDCGAVISQSVINALGHNYQNSVIAPTCTEKGYALHTCSRCGNSYKDSYTAALGHDFGEWTVMTEATCTKDGKESRTCARCNFVETQAIAALGHEYLNGVCIYCGEKDPNYKPGPVHCNGGKNCPSRLFSDLVPKQWYHEGIDYAIENDLMNGVDTRLFDPNGSLTRAMLVTILYRMENEPHVNWKDNPFDDVPYGAWYTNAVIWAAREGIVNGISETEFAPDEFITREQIAAILYRYAGSPRVHGNLRFFADNDSISEYAYDAMVWAVDKEIITGSDYLLLPKDDATRAQIANILYRYIVN